MDRRRFLLLSLTATALPGCTRQADEPPPLPTASPPHTPVQQDDGRGSDDDVRAGVVATELGLIALYGQALRSMPRRTQQLRALLDEHVEHLERLSPDTETPVAASPSEEPPAGAVAGSGAEPRRVRLRDLVAAESQAQQRHAAACLAAEDAGLTRTLCLISASEAQHAVVLRRPPRSAAP